MFCFAWRDGIRKIESPGTHVMMMTIGAGGVGGGGVEGKKQLPRDEITMNAEGEAE